MTVAAPAPRPERKRPRAKSGRVGARVERTAPQVERKEVRSMGRRRPREVVRGPAGRAAQRPPRVNMEVAREN